MRAVLLLVALFVAAGATADPAAFDVQRRRLVDSIAPDVRDTCRGITGREPDSRVFAAMREVPREKFVPADMRADAYANRPLPIGYGQTISQPYIVALMTALLPLRPESKVLEIGTGSGYQAAILAKLVAKVCTIEIIEPLASSAAQRLQNLGFTNVEVRNGDGYYGWKEQAPFDAIIVTAAATHIPPPLIAQLAPGGAIVIPVGSRFGTQELVMASRQKDGTIRTRSVLPVIFVPLTGGHGEQ